MASNINIVVISGNTTRDVELRRTQSGMPIASFGMAVNDRRKNAQTGEYEDIANFVDVVGFGERWEKLAGYISKGTKLTVHGKLRYSSWQAQDGSKRSKLEVVAEDVELPPRQNGQGGAQGGYGQQAGGYAYGGGNAPQAAPQRPQGGYGYGQPAPQQQGGYQQQATQQQPVYAPTREEMPTQSDFESSIYDDDIPF